MIAFYLLQLFSSIPFFSVLAHCSQWTINLYIFICFMVTVGDGQGGLVCCDSWGLKESDTTERLI